MKKLLAVVLTASAIFTVNPAVADSNSLQVTQRESEGDLIINATLPSSLTLKSDFQVTWRYEVKFVTAEGHVGDFSTEQKIVKGDLRSASYFFYLPLNGLYKISLEATTKNGGKKEVFAFSTDYNLNNPNRYSIAAIPADALPTIVIPNPVNGDELVQVQIGSNHNVAGTNQSSGYKLADYVRLVNDYSDSAKYYCTETRDFACSGGQYPGITLMSIPKSYYLQNRINYSQGWTISIYNPQNDSRIFSYRFKTQGEIKIEAWESDRSKAPDANQSNPGLECPYSFTGNVLKCTIKPTNRFSMPEGAPIWVEAQLYIDGAAQKKYLKSFKTRIGVKSAFSLQLPAGYRNLEIVAKTLGIGGESEKQSWTVTQPLTATQKQKSYKSGYGSVMISSQDNLRAMNFYSMATGADGRVVRSKAESWCRYALQSQIFRGEISSTNDWIRGCTDAAMKL